MFILLAVELEELELMREDRLHELLQLLPLTSILLMTNHVQLKFVRQSRLD